MTRFPTLALALATLAVPALAQEAATPAENQPQTESQETRPTNQTSQQTTEGQTAREAAADQPEDALPAGQESQGGTGGIMDAQGNQLGNVSVSATASGHALVLINAEGLPPGIHAMHLHLVGACEGPGFESAGEHIAGGNEHGVMTDTGPHPGDLPNANVGEDGTLDTEAVAIGLTMDMVFDEDGSAFIIHSDPDDYTTQPGGNSGDRIACAVIQAAPGTMTDSTTDASVVSGEPAGGDLDEDLQDANEGAQPQDPALEDGAAAEVPEAQDGQGANGEPASE
ncbi:superoxide dismutase family protein [Rubellimicrobium aerolatum]|uniref:Superoxide dismutase [Cu-Zn] n=1 Tax=Rubellimicrobium aerolatum TaxID=490979 RepID=A0ABW0SBI3_9RHOB|nr:superoxide dismutase family protein [Rubellimicrobium aerolatum]MBP1805596.1 Cu-Zn family superoxide dismutase [Rubellimicrobium aerolatum]